MRQPTAEDLRLGGHIPPQPSREGVVAATASSENDLLALAGAEAAAAAGPVVSPEQRCRTLGDDSGDCGDALHASSSSTSSFEIPEDERRSEDLFLASAAGALFLLD